jgi:hypothetical protein
LSKRYGHTVVGKIHLPAPTQLNRRPAGDQPQMASVDDVRAGVLLATRQAQDGTAALQQAGLAFEQARSTFITASQGSVQPEVEQINGMLAQAVQQVNDATNSVNAAIDIANGYAARL